jgi:ABC-type transporter Mla maintaining outer membrane lipid asymmetry ATPase subunit MlaF
MVSSEHPELLAICDRFIVIGNGKIVGELSHKEADETKIIRMASCGEGTADLKFRLRSSVFLRHSK